MFGMELPKKSDQIPYKSPLADSKIINSAGQATWVVAPAGCSTSASDVGTPDSSACTESRGGLYNDTKSTSWTEIGNFSLGLGANFGYDIFNATYGFDTVSLGFGGDIGGPTLKSQVVAALAPDFYYLGLFGLNHQATNLTDFAHPHTSYLTRLKEMNLIPSLSWAYTAGAHYSKLPDNFECELFHPNDYHAVFGVSPLAW